MIIVESIQKVSEEVIFTQCMLHSFSFCNYFPVVNFTCFESLVHAVSDGFTKGRIFADQFKAKCSPF